MFLSGSEFSRLTDKDGNFINMPTSGIRPPAWKDNYYETYRIHVTLHAVRLHPQGQPPYPHDKPPKWYAVDRYHDRVATYRKVMALLNPAEEADSYVLQPGGIFNVGIANSQRVSGEVLPGGAWQFEYVGGSRPLPDEHVSALKESSRVPL